MMTVDLKNRDIFLGTFYRTTLKNNYKMTESLDDNLSDLWAALIRESNFFNTFRQYMKKFSS